MKDITIFDNFINDEELEEARQFINTRGITHKSGEVEWRFEPTDNCDKKFILDETDCPMLPPEWIKTGRGRVNDLSSYAKKYILKIQNKIEKCFDKKFKLWRSYLNRQVCGQDVTLHIDDNKYNAYTLLIYIGDITPENYCNTGGDLEFEDENNTRVEPFTKRAVLFKGYIPHKAYAPLIPGITRISFAIKLLCISEDVPFIVKYG
tara:strand:- start:875 stop:1492 length:618 start_codon:yes stop_codon:yes gene_type:complete